MAYVKIFANAAKCWWNKTKAPHYCSALRIFDVTAGLTKAMISRRECLRNDCRCGWSARESNPEPHGWSDLQSAQDDTGVTTAIYCDK